MLVLAKRPTASECSETEEGGRGSASMLELPESTPAVGCQRHVSGSQNDHSGSEKWQNDVRMSAQAETIVDLYERNALRWDHARRSGRFLERSWLDRMCSTIPSASSILDIGCGGGEPVAQYLIQCGFHLTGIDTSSTMVDLSRDRFPQHEWIVGDMREMSIGREFRALVAWDSFFHLSHDHQRRMFSIFKQHAAPGAALLFTGGPEHGEAMGSFEAEPLYHASLAASEYESLLDASGFSVTAHVVMDSACGDRTVWLAHRTAGETHPTA
jgi:SAM-dependent methyltransferase